MPLCSICSHEQRSAIEDALARRVSLRNIAKQFDVGYSAVDRHKNGCLAGAVQRLQEAEQVVSARTILQQIQDLQRETIAILQEARAAKRYTAAVMAIGAAIKNLELQARLTGELDERPIILHPEWLLLQDRILDVLTAYPAALESVRHALTA